MTTNLIDVGNIGFIGAGNMALSFIGGLVEQGLEANKIWASDPHLVRRDLARNRFGITTLADNGELAGQVDTIVLAVKPQEMQPVCLGFRGRLTGRAPLIISIAAGVTVNSLTHWLGSDQTIVRAMPNTPALVGAGAAALFAPSSVSSAQRQLAQAILEAVGTAHWVERETQMDVVTAISGSGPAYFFLVMEALRDAAIGLGMKADTAEQLVQETALGAAQLIQARNVDAATLRRQVTSPGGTTERALKVMEQHNLRELLRSAVEAATERGRQMAAELAPTHNRESE